MDTRKALKPGKITVSNGKDNFKEFNIVSEIGRGGSCIAYHALEMTNQGVEIPIRLKECYPNTINISRTESGLLIVDDSVRDKYEATKERVEKAFRRNSELFGQVGLSNGLSTPINIFYANNTVYCETAYDEGIILSNTNIDNLYDAVKVTISVANKVKILHDNGYLYLDIKPENIWIYNNCDIKLFDFDSLMPLSMKDRLDATNYMISYSAGFAPVEQQMGEIKKIGTWTDVYGVGALLFYLIFGRAPQPIDWNNDDIYFFDKSICAGKNYPNKLFSKLLDLFNKSLNCFYKNRIQDMDELIRNLESILLYCDEKKLFVVSSNIPNRKVFIGRENEIELLNKWLSDNDEKILVVSGFGGIGKTSIVQRFIFDNKEILDNYLFVPFNNDIVTTIVDDNSLYINGVEKEREESADNYFHRKLRKLKECFAGKKNLLVIDNFTGSIESNLSYLMDLPCKLIIITRELQADNFKHIKVEEINNLDTLVELFAAYLDEELPEESVDDIRHLVKKAYQNTLIIELLAKQINASHLNIQAAIKLLENHGITNNNLEKVEIFKDSKKYYDTLDNIIKNIFAIDNLDEEELIILANITQFTRGEIQAEELKELAKINNFDAVNTLIRKGWLSGTKDLIVHPLIFAYISTVEWDENVNIQIEKSLKEIYKNIRLEGHKNEYPGDLAYKVQDIRQKFADNEIVMKALDRSIDNISKKHGVCGEITAERLRIGHFAKPCNKKLLARNICYAICWLEYHKDDEIVTKTAEYRNIELEVVSTIDSEFEEIILSYGKDILDNFPEGLELDKTATTDIYERIIDVLTARGEMDEAWLYLEKYRKYSKCRGNYVKGRYYDALSWYFDSSHEVYDLPQEQYSREMDIIDKSIFYMKHSRERRAKYFYAKYLLSKANILIRYNTGNKKDIEDILNKSKKIIEKDTLNYSKLRLEYYTVRANFYTYIDLFPKMIAFCMEKALTIAKEIELTMIEQIDEIIIPLANTLLEIGDYQNSEEWLNVAIAECDKHQDMEVYIRKKDELLKYIQDVHNASTMENK